MSELNYKLFDPRKWETRDSHESVIQSVLFLKEYWHLREAVEWLQYKELKASKLDETKTFYRFRQLNPTALKKKGFTEYRTVKLVNSIVFVLACKPNLAHNEDYI